MSIEPDIKLKKSIDPIVERVKGLHPSGIRKFFDLIQTMEDVISLGVGEPDYSTPWHIREAAIYSLEKGNTMYTSNAGLFELRQAVADYLRRIYRLSYDPNTEVLITVGVSEGIDLATRAMINIGDEVIMPDPSYVSYNPCVTLAGGRAVMVPTCEENNFEISATDIKNHLSDKTKAILIGYPSNPTGAILPPDKAAEIGELIDHHDLLCISDEIYARVTYGTVHTCMATLPGLKTKTILLGGFSKCYAMTGWRIGYAVGPAQIIGAMTKIHQYSMLCAPIMSQVAALEALKEGEEDIREMVEDYNRRRLLMLNGFNNLGLSCFNPHGAFYAFPSIKSTDMTSEDFAQKLLVEERVAVVPGSSFGQCGEGYIRCCYAVAIDTLKEALERINRFLTRHRV
jgi:aminotransferase